MPRCSGSSPRTPDLVPAALARRIDLELSAGLSLIDNAVRYSPPGSKVKVQATEQSGRVVVAITDEGAGIAPGELEKLGQRFHRVLGTGEPGSGLGISIAQRVAELHDGTMAFETPSGGRGLRVTVSLPANEGATVSGA